VLAVRQTPFPACASPSDTACPRGANPGSTIKCCHGARNNPHENSPANVAALATRRRIIALRSPLTTSVSIFSVGNRLPGRFVPVTRSMPRSCSLQPISEHAYTQANPAVFEQA